MATNVKSASVSTVILALVWLCFSPVSLKATLPQIIRKSFLTHCTILGPGQGKFGWPFLLLFRISCVFGIIFLNIITLDGIILAEKEKLKTRILAHSALSNWASVTKVSWGRFFFALEANSENNEEKRRLRHTYRSTGIWCQWPYRTHQRTKRKLHTQIPPLSKKKKKEFFLSRFTRWKLTH